MTSNVFNAFSAKGQGIVKTPSTKTTIHLHASPSTKAPGQRDLDLNETTETPTPLGTASSSPVNFATQLEKDPVKAYLRIRPLPSTQTQPSSSYLKVLDDKHVSFIPSEDTNAYRKRQGASDQYQFTKVFTNNTNQQQFFEETTLPLVQSFIHGNNTLVFAYGVTNSGKTYTMLGNTVDPGIVPRTIHTLFNNLQDHLSQARLKPVMHSTIQSYDSNHDPKADDQNENRSLLLDALDTPDYDFTHDNKTVLDVDTRYEYGIWISFAEIYNEKVYDLLESPNNKKQSKRSALSLKYEYRSGYKYVAGLKHVRVKSAKEAYAVIKKGQQNRVVFSTLMNQSSSRSHSIFTISLVRCPIDKENYVVEDPACATMSKMSIVDLAGSERYRNTFNQGQRLKEAGNINKSLMVLGQCMETLRMNQIKIESGKRPAMVPFRQSKLTELFKNTFEGDGQATIVVNVNPFDTGFDENSHVMKFAAIAKQVTTVQQPKKLALHDISDTLHKRQRRNTMSSNLNGESHSNDTAFGEYHNDTFVNHLLEQMECLRDKWLDAEARCSAVESEVRRQISLETKLELAKMEDMYISLLRQQNQTMETQIDSRLEALGNIDENEESPDQLALSSLKLQQQQLFLEINKLHRLLKDRAIHKQTLLDKISGLENDKAQEQATTKRLGATITQLKTIINHYRNNIPLSTLSSSTATEDENLLLSQSTGSGSGVMVEDNNSNISDGIDRQYADFLELRKQLRRSVFKREELLEDAENILYKIEQFENVTFDLVKNTKMGKLLKLITQEEFKSDPYLIQQRALELFKRFARLPRSNSPQQQQHQQQQQQQQQLSSSNSLINSTEYHSKIDDFDHGYLETTAANTLLNGFGDDDDDVATESDSDGPHGMATGIGSHLNLESNNNSSLGESNTCETMVSGDDASVKPSATANDGHRRTRKRRRTLRSSMPFPDGDW